MILRNFLLAAFFDAGKRKYSVTVNTESVTDTNLCYGLVNSSLCNTEF